MCNSSNNVNVVTEILDAMAVAQEGLAKANDVQFKGTSVAHFPCSVNHIAFS